MNPLPAPTLISRTAVAAVFALPLACQTPYLVADINPGAAHAGVDGIAVLGDHIVFSAFDPTSIGLYLGDASGASRFYVLDSAPPLTGPTRFVTSGGRVYFTHGDTTTGLELWSTDGTAAGTGLVKDIRPGLFSGLPQNLADVDGVLYFAAASSGANLELWKSDGTAVGTTLVAEIHTSASAGSIPDGMTALGSTGRFVFAATDSVAGRELWVSDGTAAGTTMVADIWPGAGAANSSAPSRLTRYGDRVLFNASTSTGTALWVTDGTAAGTTPFFPAGVGPSAGGAGSLAVQGGQLLFAGTSSSGAELWISDGTAAGTTLLDLNPGPNSSLPEHLTPIGSTFVYFAAWSPTVGMELWRVDATSAELHADISVGSSDSSPHANGTGRFAVLDGSMFFVANDGIHGEEVWVLPGTAAATGTIGSGCGGLGLSTSEAILGQVLTLQTTGIPATATVAGNVWSFLHLVPAVDLAPLGLPGCSAHVEFENLELLPPSGTRTLLVPDSTAYLGFEAFSQSFALVPGVNPFGGITSNAVSIVVGDL